MYSFITARCQVCIYCTFSLIAVLAVITILSSFLLMFFFLKLSDVFVNDRYPLLCYLAADMLQNLLRALELDGLWDALSSCLTVVSVLEVTGPFLKSRFCFSGFPVSRGIFFPRPTF